MTPPSHSPQDSNRPNRTPPLPGKLRGYLQHVLPGTSGAWLVLAIGVVITILAWQVLSQAATQKSASRFQYRVERITSEIAKRMRYHEYVLRGAAGLFAVTKSVSRDQWREYVDRVQIEQEKPATLGIGFLQRVPAGAKAAHVQSMHGQGFPNYAIFPDGEREEYYPVTYFEPRYENRGLAFGYDMFADPARRPAMGKARDTGKAAISTKVKLVHDPKADDGVVMYLPVYGSGQNPDTLAQRRTAIRGFVYSPFRLRETLEAILRDDISVLGVRVYDGEAALPERLLFDSSTRQPAPPGELAMFTKITTLGPDSAAWTIEFRSLPEFDAMVQTNESRVVLILGLVTSLLLFGIIRALATTRTTAEALANDRTAQLRDAMARITRSEAHMRAVLDNALDAIVTINERSEIESFNPAAERIFGYRQEEVIGRTVELLVPEPHRSHHAEYVDNYLRTGEGKIIGVGGREVTGLRKDGTVFPMELGVTELRAGGRRLFIGILRDITRRKQAEQALQQERENLEIRVQERTESLTQANLALQEEIRERKRIEAELVAAREDALQAARAKSEFLANMSHEIRTPMNAVIGMTGLLMETRLTQEQQEYVEIVRVSGDTLLTVINDILDFSKIESGRMELEEQPFELAACIEEAYDLLSPKALDKKIDLLYVIDHQVPSVIVGDPTRLRQILVNLVSNAIKFTDQGEVCISVNLLNAQQDKVTLQFAVKDTGIGIPREKLERLFMAFSQGDTSTTRKYGGTGLGLVICSRLARMMGGAITVESEPGHGSTFFVTMTTRKASVIPPKLYLRGSLPELAGKRVLIVDDNATNLQILGGQCKRWGLMVRSTASCREALGWIEQGDPFDLAILDLHMPEMDGYELGARMRALRPRSSLPLVLLSSSVLKQQRTPQNSMLFSAVMAKPIKQSQLFDILMDVLGHVKRAHAAPESGKLDPKLAERLPLRTLVVEDSTINQKLMLAMLQKMGYVADVAGNGVEALEAMKLKRYDLIFMDVQMPELDGIEATRKIVAEWPRKERPVIIAMTANAMHGDREKCLDAGMNDYISKPVLIEDIQDMLQRWGEHNGARSSRSNGAASLLDQAVIDELRELDESGKPSMMKGLIQDYLDQAPDTIGQIKAFARSGNSRELAHKAHKLHGLSLTFGAVNLSDICKRIQLQADDGNLNDMDTLFAELDAAYGQASEELKRLLKE